MIEINNIDVWGFKHAVRGMRNPLNSWDKGDSYFEDDIDVNSKAFSVGEKDLDLMHRLYKAGTEHRKYLRQIFVSMDIVAPLYWWKQADQYRIGVTTNSCSTMHRIATKEFELDDFSHEHLYEENIQVLKNLINDLNFHRANYLYTKDKNDWWQLIQLLPSSYNQKRTWTGSYENLITMYHQRRDHKLDEWRTFCDVILTLPYIKEIMEIDNGQN